MEDYDRLTRTQVLQRLQKHKAFAGESQKKIAEQLGGIKEMRDALRSFDKKAKDNQLLTIQYLQQLQKTKEYLNLTEDQILARFGDDVDLLKDEVNRIKKQHNTFGGFENLPGELQSVILSQNPKTLSYSPRISQSIRKSPAVMQSYYKQFCDKPIQNSELQSYLSTFQPETWVNLSFKNSSFTIIRIYYHFYDGIEGLSYKENYHFYDNWDAGILVNTRINNLNNIAISNNDFLDINTVYNIYKQRECEKIKPGYSKEKTKYLLNSIWNNSDGYENAVMVFIYFRANLKIFNEPTPKNIYKNIVISEKNENALYGKQQLSFGQLLDQLDEQNEIMYKQLVDIIDKLD